MSINLLENKVEYVNYEEENQDVILDDNLAPTNVSEEYSVVDDSQIVGDSQDEVSETIYKKTTRWILLVGTMLVPLFFLPWTTGILELNKQILLVVFAGIGLVLWLLDVATSGKISWRFNPIDKGVVAMAGAVVLSSIFSVAKFKSIFGMAGSLSDSVLTVAALTVVYLLAVNSFNDKGKALKLFFSVSITATIFYGLLQIFGVYIVRLPFALSRAFNTLGSVNVLGMMSAVILPMLYRTKISIFRYFDISRVGAVAALAVLIVINWWALWAVAIAGMVAMVVLENLSSSHKEGFRMSRFLFPMTVMVLGILLVVVNLNLVFVKNNLPMEIAPSYKLSSKIVRGVLKENLAFGYGPENFSIAFDKYGASELRGSTLSGIKFFESTAQIFNVAVHGGLVGLAGLFFAIFMIGWSLFKIFKSKVPDLDSESVGIASSVIAAVIAMFFYPFNLALIFTFYSLLALFVLTFWDREKKTYDVEKKASLSLISSLGFIGGLILTLLGVYFVSLNYVADLKYVKALNQTEIKSAMDYVIEAINWNEKDDRYYRLSSQLALNLLSSELSKPQADQKAENVQNYLSSAVALAQKATQVAPQESNNWNNLANVYQNLMQLVNGADALAESAYLRASELRPGDPSFHNRIGSMYLFKADLVRQLMVAGGASAQQLNQQVGAALLKSEDAFKQAIELSSNFGLAIYNLGAVYERQNKLNEAIGQLEKIAPFNSNQAGLAFELGLLYYRANQKGKSFEQLQRAVVLFPDYANARWYLALIYEERGEIDQAKEQLERILSIEANKDNQIVLSKLSELDAGKVSIPPGKVLDQKPL